MITLWKRTPTGAAATDGRGSGEEIQTSAWVAAIPIFAALIAGAASVWVAFINSSAGSHLERERRETALAVERLKEDLLRTRPATAAASTTR